MVTKCSSFIFIFFIFIIWRNVTFPRDRFDSDTTFSGSMLVCLRNISFMSSHSTPYETDAGSVKLSLHLFHRHRFRRHFPKLVLTTKKVSGGTRDGENTQSLHVSQIEMPKPDQKWRKKSIPLNISVFPRWK